MERYRKVRLADIPSSDGKLPEYRFVLLSEDGRDWQASTENRWEGLPAFRRLVELKCATEIVEVEEYAHRALEES